MNFNQSVLQSVAVVFLILFSYTGFCATVTQTAVSERQTRLTLDNGQTVTVEFMQPLSVAVTYEQPERKTMASMALPINSETQPFHSASLKEGLTLSRQQVRVDVSYAPFQLSFYYNGTLITRQTDGGIGDDGAVAFSFDLTADEQLYGGGQRVVGMDRRGQRLPLYNQAHYGYSTSSQQMYYSLPAVLSSRHYAILFDNTARGMLDTGMTQAETLTFSATGGRASYLVTLGENTRHVATNTVRLTGLQPLPPRWTLGNFASRFGYHTQQEVMDTVALFGQAGIPLDTVVLDLYWFGKDVKGHMGNLDWDREAFPDPDDMIATLRDNNINTVLITEPFVLTTSSTFTDASTAGALATDSHGNVKTYDFFFGHTGLIDVFSDKGKAWFAAQYTRLLSQGVAGIWGDLGEPEVHPAELMHEVTGQRVGADLVHNAYGHEWAALVQSVQRDVAPGKRPFLLMRSGFLGSQRYGMIPWTGDVSRSWGGLQPQVELALQMSLFGLAYTHSDLGGFAGGDAFDPQLYLRWLQLGEFQPVFRPHAQEDIAPEPVFHSDAVKAAARDIINRRYALLPYNYSLMVHNSETGLSLMRPLSFYHTGADWFNDASSFYWGPFYLVSPVTRPDVTNWPVALPDGIWFVRDSDKRIDGGKTVMMPVDDTTTPVFIRRGAIVPMISPANTTQEADFSRLEVHVWIDDSGLPAETAFQYVEDDGLSVSQQRHRIDFSLTASESSVTLEAKGYGDYAGMPDARSLVWIIHGLTAMPQAMDTLQPEQHKTHWDNEARLLSVTMPYTMNQRLTVTF
ncbi:TIM-barrel domain-containing protein [Alteromonas sp. CYL-A6]|uniref:TIM-barrel domain-containing protein n=1 Tax=Alteromonas nitratireducens TaxID=3390813 RepID=UPI0034ABCA02